MSFGLCLCQTPLRQKCAILDTFLWMSDLLHCEIRVVEVRFLACFFQRQVSRSVFLDIVHPLVNAAIQVRFAVLQYVNNLLVHVEPNLISDRSKDTAD